ncbi:arsenic resistance protein [Chakrabartyella piscis]|uniref:arsenic resistance protein n=1 Tax=Chakrabartyella piscis TaxID=2918914 RepID=UPI002958C064|nr:bile acid:sodium symporter [Chakrabartyella piscis]
MTFGAKIQPILILAAALVGLLLGKYTPLGNVSSGYIELFLMMLLYILFLSVDLGQLRTACKNIKYTNVALVINFVITPVIAYVLGNVFFGDSIEIRIGLLMLLVTPCTDWYLVFTGLAKGNVELNISILPINLILQIVLMPVYLFVFLGSEIQMEVSHLLQSIVFVLLIPFVFALVTNQILKKKEVIKEWVSQQSDNLQMLFLCLAVIVMFASQGSNLFANPMLLCRLFVPLLIFFALLFCIAQGIGKVLQFPKRDIVALNFTTLARNSPLSLAIAVAAFPDYPLVALALVIGPLIELPVLSVVSNILLKWNVEKEAKEIR